MLSLVCHISCLPNPEPQPRVEAPAPPAAGSDVPRSGDRRIKTSMLDALSDHPTALSEMADEYGWQRWSSQIGDPVGLVRDLWTSCESREGPRRSLVAGKVRRPVPVPHVQLTCVVHHVADPSSGTCWGCAFRSFSGACGSDWRPTVGRPCPLAGSLSADVLGELPAEEGEGGRPAAIARVEIVPLVKVRRRRAVRSHRSTRLLLRAFLSPRGCDIWCSAATRRNDVPRSAGTVEVVHVTPVSLEGARVLRLTMYDFVLSWPRRRMLVA